jgi:hypothetical protein
MVLGMASQARALTTGPTSAYYLNNYSEGRVYVVQGTTVISSFGQVYSPGYAEGTLAVSGGTVRTRSFETSVPGGGVYTLGGTPTGVSYSYPAPAGVAHEYSYDGTSDGLSNYYVSWAPSSGPQTVYRTDLNWQSPVALFAVGSCCFELSIAWDPRNNSLWIGDYGSTMVSNYTMAGTLLSSFSTGHTANSALAFDAADNTLWLVNGQGNNLEQWSTAGSLLQSGAVSGLSGCCFLSGEFAMAAAVPAPAALMMVGLGVVGLIVSHRRR